MPSRQAPARPGLPIPLKMLLIQNLFRGHDPEDRRGDEACRGDELNERLLEGSRGERRAVEAEQAENEGHQPDQVAQTVRLARMVLVSNMSNDP
jgi:hypothetical protein